MAYSPRTLGKDVGDFISLHKIGLSYACSLMATEALPLILIEDHTYI